MKALKAVALLVFVGLVALSLPTTASSREVALGITGTGAQFDLLRGQGLPARILASWVTWSEPSPERVLGEAEARGADPFINWQPEGIEGHPVTVPAIDAGDFDWYIARWATAVAGHDGPVYLRLGHEMNGKWYPWSETGAVAYRAMWRRVVPQFKAIAPNARFIWSPDGLIGHEQRDWERGLAKWFPGRRFVDLVGMSTVGFKTSAPYGVPYFFRRIDFLRKRFRKPVALSEMKVYEGGRYKWLAELRHALDDRPWVKMLIWSETESTAQALGEFETGNMNWSLSRDGRARALLRRALGD